MGLGEGIIHRPLRRLAAPDGYWAMNDPFTQRYTSIFNIFTGHSSHLSWMITLPYAKAFIASILAGIKMPNQQACDAVFALLLILTFVFALIQMWFRPYRLFIDVVTHGVLSFMIGVLLLTVLFGDEQAAFDVYITIVVLAMLTTGLTLIMTGYEFFIGKPNEAKQLEAEEEEKEKEKDKKDIDDDDNNDSEVDEDNDDEATSSDEDDANYQLGEVSHDNDTEKKMKKTKKEKTTKDSKKDKININNDPHSVTIVDDDHDDDNLTDM